MKRLSDLAQYLYLARQIAPNATEFYPTSGVQPMGQAPDDPTGVGEMIIRAVQGSTGYGDSARTPAARSQGSTSRAPRNAFSELMNPTTAMQTWGATNHGGSTDMRTDDELISMILGRHFNNMQRGGF